LSASPVRCSHFTLGNLNMSFFNIIIHILQNISLPQKKTNSNCGTAALAVYLLLFNASYYLHSPSTLSGACYMRNACIDTDMLRLVAAACCDIGLNCSTARCSVRLISDEKDWKHVLI